MTAPHLPKLVFADTNVLYGSATRDIFIELDVGGLISLRWSASVLDELSRALVRTRPDYTVGKALALIAAMTEALPEALVLPPATPPASLTLTDPDDVHVAAAASHGGCPILLTFNIGDFPDTVLSALIPPVQAIHPDTFLVSLMATQAVDLLQAIETIRKRLQKPPMSRVIYADHLTRAGLPRTAELLRHLSPP
jgi:predicted nucleic acid-binding protein